MRTIGVVTVSRSDYGAYLPVLRKIQADTELKLHLIVAGAHLSSDFGLTVKEIEADGFEIGEQVKISYSSDTPEGIAKSMGQGTLGFAEAYARFRPDILLVLGDRFEMHAAALAALPFKIPLAHIHGGELTEGAFDDALRHSITKLAHLHFVSTQEYAERVIQLGEEPWRVTVSGAPSLDNLRSMRLLTAEELLNRSHVRVSPKTLLVTFHSVTLEYEETKWQTEELLAALESSGLPAIFTMPNADTNNRLIRRRIQDFLKTHPSAQAIENLGTIGYFSLMSLVVAMVGNSSSGIIEAPSFKLPVVNIGTRQQGRLRAANVIEVGYKRTEIVEGIKKAVRPSFRESLRDLVNPYGNGKASEKITEHLKKVVLEDQFLIKRFNDTESPSTKKNVLCVILGGGGHARVLIDSIKASGVAIPHAVLDSDSSHWGQELLGVPILGGDDLLPELVSRGVSHFVVGLGSTGDHRPRQRLFELALSKGFKPLTVVHPTAICSPQAKVGRGAQLLPASIVNAGAEIGENTIINTGAIVEHDCFIGNHVHIATGARLASTVRVGNGAHVGVGASIRQSITIGERAIVGAGAVVVKDVEPYTVVAGVPARPQSEGVKA